MTIDLQNFLKNLISQPGLSGHEEPVRQMIQDAWQPLVDETSTSRLGSLHALKRGSGLEPRPSILLSAHMDAIGMMVTGSTQGFLRFTKIGGVDPRVLPGQLVTVHGRQDLPGVVVQPPSYLLPSGVGDAAVAMMYLLIDTGMNERELRRNVRVGDLISYAQEPMNTAGETLVGHSLDNRASVAAVTYTLQLLQGRQHIWDVWAVASSQEEETLGGARTSAFELRPSLAVVIDVTFAVSPGSPAHLTYPLAKGPTLGWGPNIHPALFNAFKDLADRLEIPYTLEVMPRHSGTDAFAIQVVAEGIPCMVVSIPLRYMHTPVEMVAIKDIQRAGRLIAEYITGLPADYLSQVNWVD